MRAVWMQRFGGPEVLVAGDAPDPVAGPGQVVIAVAYAGITFVETQLRAGVGPFPVEPPMILGNGVGGVVVAVGDGVAPGLRDARVISGTGGSGGYAERAAVDAAGLLHVPPDLALDSAVALLADGRTAALLVEVAGLRAGDRVLVEAAAGGVGSLLVQLAQAAGAVVVAAAGGARKVAIARELGAEVAVDYRDPEWPAAVRAAVGGVDVVLDGVGGAIGRAAADLLAHGGRLVVFGAASGAWNDITDEVAGRHGVTVLRGPRPSAVQARTLTEGVLAEAAAGRLHPLIGQRFPLARAADAHAAIEARTTVGKTLLEVG